MARYNVGQEWGPLLTAMVTPMKEDCSVDYEDAERLADFLIEKQGNTGIVVAGTTGESPTLSDEEKLELLRVTLSAVGKKAKIIFGAGTYDTEHSIHLTKEATKLGANGIMLVSPYYNKPNQEGLYAHFKKVAQATELPVMLYNIQGRTAVNIETKTLLRLINDVPNICAVKEASGNLAQVVEVCAGVPESFAVYSGDDILTLPILSVGGCGIISVAAHVAGRPIRKMIDAFFQGDMPSAIKQNKELVPLFKALFLTTNPIPVKYAVSLLGFNTSTMRLPLTPLGEEGKRAVETAMAQAGILTGKAAVQA